MEHFVSLSNAFASAWQAYTQGSRPEAARAFMHLARVAEIAARDAHKTPSAAREEIVPYIWLDCEGVDP